MHLQYVSITGADDAVDIAALNDIANAYPFVEFALLLMPERMGENRFPTMSWIEDFKANYWGAHKAMHLCGSGFLGFVKGEKAILNMMDGFNRIQLNLKFGDVDGQYEDEQLLARIRENPAWEFIIQYTPDKVHLLAPLAEISNHAVLFDASAGRGVSPDEWPAPLPGHFCGYAGGLSPENIANNLARIAQATDDIPTWIDMESGVRTDDRFDLEKIKEVLENCRSRIS